MKTIREDWDKLLRIRTSGRDDSRSNHINFPYEPTPYEVLELLVREQYIGKKNTVLDYGCGKGRVDFYLAFETKCRCIGIDYDERMIAAADDNRETAVSGRRVEFIHANAARFEVPDEADRIYFFNPFSVEVLQSALTRIKESMYAHPREILLLFYYPSDEYVAFLMQQDALSFEDEIDCREIYKNNDDRERILIFRMEEN